MGLDKRYVVCACKIFAMNDLLLQFHVTGDGFCVGFQNFKTVIQIRRGDTDNLGIISHISA